MGLSLRQEISALFQKNRAFGREMESIINSTPTQKCAPTQAQESTEPEAWRPGHVRDGIIHEKLQASAASLDGLQADLRGHWVTIGHTLEREIKHSHATWDKADRPHLFYGLDPHHAVAITYDTKKDLYNYFKLETETNETIQPSEGCDIVTKTRIKGSWVAMTSMEFEDVSKMEQQFKRHIAEAYMREKKRVPERLFKVFAPLALAAGLLYACSGDAAELQNPEQSLNTMPAPETHLSFE